MERNINSFSAVKVEVEIKANLKLNEISVFERLFGGEAHHAKRDFESFLPQVNHIKMGKVVLLGCDRFNRVQAPDQLLHEC